MAWSVLQSASADYYGSTYFPSATYTSNLASGSKLFCYVALGDTPVTEISSVKDTAGNSFTLQASVSGSPDDSLTLAIYTLDTPAGDAGTTTVVTAATANKSKASILIQEVSGLLAGSSGIMDGTAGTVIAEIFSAGGTLGPPAYGSSSSSEFLVSFYGDNEYGGTFTWTAPATYTADTHSLNTLGTTSGCNLAVAYKNSAGGTESGGWGYAGSANDCGAAQILVAFKLAGGGPSFTAPPNRPRGQAVNRASTY